MPTRLNAVIKDVVLWSDREEIKTVHNIPIGTTLVEAWFVIKSLASDADDDALLLKTVTPIADPLQGHIADVGTFKGGKLGIGRVIFVLTATELGTYLEAPREYFYGMKAKLSNGKVGEFEQGTLNTVVGVLQQIT